MRSWGWFIVNLTCHHCRKSHWRRLRNLHNEICNTVLASCYIYIESGPCHWMTLCSLLMYELWGECVTVDGWVVWVVDCWLVGPWVGNKLLFELHVSLLSSQTYTSYMCAYVCMFLFWVTSFLDTQKTYAAIKTQLSRSNVISAYLLRISFYNAKITR